MANWLVALSAIGGFITGALSYWKGRKNGEALHVIYVNTNQRLSDTVSRVDQLIEIIKEADIEVPPKPTNKTGAT